MIRIGRFVLKEFCPVGVRRQRVCENGVWLDAVFQLGGGIWLRVR